MPQALSYKSLALLALTTLALPAFAQLHTYTGKDRRGRECSLFVQEVGYEGEERAENMRVKVTTSFGHGSEKPEPVVLAPVADKANTLYGEYTACPGRTDNVGKTFIRASTNPDSKDWSDLFAGREFVLSWWHGTCRGGHPDVFACRDLELK